MAAVGPVPGPVGVSARLLPFLPLPIVGREPDAERVAAKPIYRWLGERDLPQSIGRLTSFGGNAGVLLRAYVYMRMLGREGMRRVGEYATLNANYLSARLQQIGFEAAYPQRRASHEFILTLKRAEQDYGVTAMDVAKRLLDLGFHAPTTYFPMLISECLLIEPTETESKQTLDAFVSAMAQILREAQEDPEQLQGAPHNLPVRRLDDVRAARELNLIYQGPRRVMKREKLQGLGRMLRAFVSSAKGFVGAFREEQAFRQELLFACLALPLGAVARTQRCRARAARGAGAADPDRRIAQQRHRSDGGPHRPGAPCTRGAGQGHRLGGRNAVVHPAGRSLAAGADRTPVTVAVRFGRGRCDRWLTRTLHLPKGVPNR